MDMSTNVLRYINVSVSDPSWHCTSIFQDKLLGSNIYNIFTLNFSI